MSGICIQWHGNAFIQRLQTFSLILDTFLRFNVFINSFLNVSYGK